MTARDSFASRSLSSNLPPEVDAIQRGPNFDNIAIKSLPVDSGDNIPRAVKNAVFSFVKPTPIDSPKLVICSEEVLELLNFGINHIPKEYEGLLAEYVSGNKSWGKSIQAAHCYCGYQFGSFAGQLGDGAAISLGDCMTTDSQRLEVQLKGSGLTPFSRTADGRKVLRSSLREFLCSEAMFYLNIPTTRALSVVTSDTFIERDPFYDGNPKMERASVTCRVSPSFLRFGSLEICHPMDARTRNTGPSLGNTKLLRQIVDFTIENHYPNIWANAQGEHGMSMYMKFFEELTTRTAALVAKWQTVGFCHGVLNTDNMSLLGLTIDYGPFGFMDRFQWSHVCNASDINGRYSYVNQPFVCYWNCERLAYSMSLMLADHPDVAHKSREDIESIFDVSLREKYWKKFNKEYMKIMRKKLGFTTAEDKDIELIFEMFDLMQMTGCDFTAFFVALEQTLEKFYTSKVFPPSEIMYVISTYKTMKSINIDELIRYEQSGLSSHTECVIHRSYDRIEKSLGDLYRFINRLDVDIYNYKDHVKTLWGNWLKKYGERIRMHGGESDAPIYERLAIMRANNPRYILRNHIAEEVIREAEKGSYARARAVFTNLKRPIYYPARRSSDASCSRDESESELVDLKHMLPPEWARTLKVT